MIGERQVKVDPGDRQASSASALLRLLREGSIHVRVNEFRGLEMAQAAIEAAMFAMKIEFYRHRASLQNQFEGRHAA